MATLVLPELGCAGSTQSSPVPLRHWLDGRWAILFSHPDDFIHCDFELDRWILIVGQAFAEARMRPIALARPHRAIDRGWISAVAGVACHVALTPARGRGDALDLAARRLQQDITGMTQRFAMIIDAALGRRRTFVYGAGAPPPSPLDLVRAASRLRDKVLEEARPQEAAA